MTDKPDTPATPMSEMTPEETRAYLLSLPKEELFAALDIIRAQAARREGEVMTKRPYARLDELPLMNTAEAAEFLGLSDVYLGGVRRDQDPTGPPFIQIGRRILYRASDLHRWVDSKTVNPATDFPAKKK